MARRRLYIDANVLITSFEGDSPAAREGGAGLDLAAHDAELVTSEITLSEVLVAPFRSAKSVLEGLYRALFERPDLLTVIAANRTVMIEAARLRAVSRMKLPDAIHVATARVSSCGALASFDRDLFVPPPIALFPPTPDAVAAWIAGTAPGSPGRST
jgi:predicted nucleic acid-binding protein